MPEGFIFEKLVVYQRGLAFAERISDLTSTFPRGSWYLADQLNRASLSISLNIAEGNGRWSPGDRRNFFAIARGSVHECVPLVELACRKHLLDDTVATNLKLELVELAKMLSGLLGRKGEKP